MVLKEHTTLLKSMFLRFTDPIFQKCPFDPFNFQDASPYHKVVLLNNLQLCVFIYVCMYFIRINTKVINAMC